MSYYSSVHVHVQNSPNLLHRAMSTDIYTHVYETLTRYHDNGSEDLVPCLPHKSVGVTEGREHQLNEVRGQVWLKGSATILHYMLQSSGHERWRGTE